MIFEKFMDIHFLSASKINFCHCSIDCIYNSDRTLCQLYISLTFSLFWSFSCTNRMWQKIDATTTSQGSPVSLKVPCCCSRPVIGGKKSALKENPSTITNPNCQCWTTKNGRNVEALKTCVSVMQWQQVWRDKCQLWIAAHKQMVLICCQICDCRFKPVLFDKLLRRLCQK